MSQSNSLTVSLLLYSHYLLFYVFIHRRKQQKRVGTYGQQVAAEISKKNMTTTYYIG